MTHVRFPVSRVRCHILAGKTSIHKTSIQKYSNIQIFEIKIIEYSNIRSSMLHFFKYIQIFVRANFSIFAHPWYQIIHAFKKGTCILPLLNQCDTYSSQNIELTHYYCCLHTLSNINIPVYTCCTLRSWLHEIPALIITLSPGLEKNHTLKRSS